MYQTVTLCDFDNAFRQTGRENQFSYMARQVLFEYLLGLEESIGEETELDVIALCCDFTEYAGLEEYNEAYGTDYKDWSMVEEMATVIPIGDTGGAVVQDH